MKLVNYDKTNGKILGWYDSEIHSIIPTPNAKVTDEQWQSAIDISANYFDGTNFSVKDFRTDSEKLAQEVQSINNAIKTHLDTKAQEFKYDNMMSARSYAGYTNPFQTEAQSLATWCANCWATAGTIKADVETGTRPMPTVNEVLAELPVYGG